MAEKIIHSTYVEKKADRLIQEFQTESDDQAEIEEVKSAVKQVQLEEEVEAQIKKTCETLIEEENK